MFFQRDKKIYILTNLRCLGVLCCLAFNLNAGELSSAVDKLAALEEKQQSLLSVDKGLKNSLSLLAEKIEKEKETLVNDMPEMAQLKKAVSDARLAYEAEESASNLGQLEQAQFKLALGERKYTRKVLASLPSTQEKKAIEKKITLSKQSISTLKEEIQQQRVKVRSLEEQERQRKLKEDVRLADSKRAAERKMVADVSDKSVKQLVPAPTPIADVPSITENDKPAVSPRVVLEPIVSGTAVLVPDIQAARERYTSLLAQADDYEKNDPRYTAQVKWYDGKSLKGKYALSLKIKGNRQYSGRFLLNAGRNSIKIAGNTWSIDVPDSIAQTPYLIWADLSKKRDANITLLPVKAMNQ